jgi:hypothetical protein
MAGDPSTPGARAWRALETVHGVGYFAPEMAERYSALGLRGRHAYFAARSAPMGPVAAEVTVAAFYVFAPDLVARGIPEAWEIAAPEQILEARHAGVRAALRRLLGEDVAAGSKVAEAAELAGTACEGLAAPGRSLYAGHAALPWPEDPLLALWHATTLLREYRGDGHVAALVLAGLSPVEALASDGIASGTCEFQRSTRGWSDEEWQAGVASLIERDLATSGTELTGAGKALRAELDESTDAASEDGWLHLGEEGTARLAELLGPLARTIATSGLYPEALAATHRQE